MIKNKRGFRDVENPIIYSYKSGDKIFLYNNNNKNKLRKDTKIGSFKLKTIKMHNSFQILTFAYKLPL